MEGTDDREETVHEPPLDNMGDGDDVRRSLEEWLPALPTFDELEVRAIQHFFVSISCMSAMSKLLTNN